MLLRRFSFFLIALAILYGVVVMALFPRAFIIDDTYITFRYAENFALHGELSWNLGEKPVEGYTGVALPVLLAFGIKAGISPAVATRSIGIFSFWLSFLALFLIGRRIRLSLIGIACILLLFVTTPILLTHSFSGMETMLFLAMMLWSAYAFLCKKDTTLFALLLLTSLIRPEGVAFSACAIIAAGWGRYRESPQALKKFLWQSALFYFLPAFAYFLWRFNYYGRLLPNTFYAKSGVGFQPEKIIDIARFLRRYFAAPVLGVAVLFAAETDRLWAVIKEFCRERKAVISLAAGVLFNLILVASFSHSHLTMNFSHRFYTMLMPVAWLLLTLAFKVGLSTFAGNEKEKPIQYRFVLTVFVLLIVYQIGFQVVKVQDEFSFAGEQVMLQANEHTLIGKTLRTIIPAGETLAVLSDAGAIPYFSGLRTVDFGGLNDAYLSDTSLPIADKVAYFYKIHPGVAVFTSINEEKVVESDMTTAIIADPRFSDYSLFRKYIFPTTALRYHEFVYLRKDLVARAH